MGRRVEHVGELGRACLLGRARGRAGRIAGQAGMGSGPQGEKGGKGLGCLSGFRAGSDWLVGFGFSIFLLFSNSSS